MNLPLSRLLIALCTAFLTLPTMANLGHRLGGDVYQPENTLYSFRTSLGESGR